MNKGLESYLLPSRVPKEVGTTLGQSDKTKRGPPFCWVRKGYLKRGGRKFLIKGEVGQVHSFSWKKTVGGILNAGREKGSGEKKI